MENRMIVIEEKLVPYQVELHHSENVFIEARDYYHATQRDQDYVGVVNEEKELLYVLSYQKNQVNELDYVSDFWDYDLESSYLDFELVDRGEVFLFLTLEEYTYACIQAIRRYAPKKYIVMMDSRASMFFQQDSHFLILNDLSDMYLYHKELLSKVIFTIDSKRDYLPNIMRCVIKRYRSLEFMNGIFWKTEMRSYGQMYPNQIFYVIRNPLRYGGMADMIKFTLYRAMMAKQKGLIPVVDLSVKEDYNQFNRGCGENAWLLFFEQLSEIPLEEVYQSKHVIHSNDVLDLFNPYVQEQIYYGGGEQQNYRTFLKLNSSTEKFVNDMYKKVIPRHSKVLGVIARGTDYRCSKGRWLYEPMQPELLIERVKEYLEKKPMDYVFLATEDSKVFEAFCKSDLKEKLLYIDQKRVEYTEEKQDQFLAELYAKDKTFDGYQFNLTYLSIISILSRCDALISGCICGASRIAIGMNDGKYEDVIVY
jgi:hypothetical protein